MVDKNNLTLLTDFYELTMANGYFEADMKDDIAYFDCFFRDVPDDGGFAIFAGLNEIIDYMENLKFSEEDIEFLRRKGGMSERFLEYLKDFKFECDVWAIPEGTPIFPGEPILTVRGPVMQAQFVETMILLLVNHESLIATKANRIVRAAQGRAIMEFGSRRAHGASAAIYGARAAYIGGCIGTACTVCERDMGIKALGTMAHSWVQMFPDEYTAFKKYAEIYPENCVLLVDTYNVLKSGVPAAIRVFKEMKPQKMGIRMMLDEAGLQECTIAVSNSLDEYIIRDVIAEGACIDSFGVGERLITAKSSPVFGGVYKLCALEKDGELIPKMKISENVGKITNPGFKTLYRLFDLDTDRAIADLITLDDEPQPTGEDMEIFDPQNIWKHKTVTNYYAKNLRVPIFEKGKLVYDRPSIEEIRAYCLKQVDSLWEEICRFENPQTYYVDLSEKLWDMKQELLKAHNR